MESCRGQVPGQHQGRRTLRAQAPPHGRWLALHLCSNIRHPRPSVCCRCDWESQCRWPWADAACGAGRWVVLGGAGWVRGEWVPAGLPGTALFSVWGGPNVPSLLFRRMSSPAGVAD